MNGALSFSFVFLAAAVFVATPGNFAAAQPATEPSMEAAVDDVPSAQSDADRARRLVDEAAAARARHRLEEARSLLEESLALAPTGRAAFNLAGVRVDIGDCLGALVLYRRLAAAEFGDLPPERAARVTERSQECQSRLARVDVAIRGEGRAQTYLDGEPVEESDGDASVALDVNPGPHHVAIRSLTTDQEALHELELDPGERVRIDFLHEDASRPAWKSPWLWVGVGAVVLGGVATAVALSLREPDFYEGDILGNIETLRASTDRP